MRELKQLDRPVLMAIVVASLGYFVDIYDLLLFSMVRTRSLSDLGVSADQMIDVGTYLMDAQMLGLLFGGVLWGVLGDKRGRLSVLFGSIFLYSAANIANAFVTTVDQYAALRLIAGIGLAGELGAGITLIAELLPQRLRGYGTSIVAGVGILGAVFGGLVAEFVPSWRAAYIIGGVMGFLVLLLRVGVRESGMFHRTKETSIARGNFFSIFTRWQTFKKFLAVILIGVPIWYVVGILMTFSPEFGKAWGMDAPPEAHLAVLFCYAGLSVGDFMSGIVSHRLQSRRKAIFGYLIGVAVMVVVFLTMAKASLFAFYLCCLIIGFFSGYWAMFVTVAAEQFGTNIRATMTTSVPNFVRASVIPMNVVFRWGIPTMGVMLSGAVTGLIAMIVAFVALGFLEETFHKDLDYHEG
ncbi:MAG TPA: MFS transporter [Bdellovibrionales bacterium]|nr:MFS transporter [Bdellovibrionales bacterium]